MEEEEYQQEAEGGMEEEVVRSGTPIAALEVQNVAQLYAPRRSASLPSPSSPLPLPGCCVFSAPSSSACLSVCVCLPFSLPSPPSSLLLSR